MYLLLKVHNSTIIRDRAKCKNGSHTGLPFCFMPHSPELLVPFVAGPNPSEF